jgi:hypothetical protein
MSKTEIKKRDVMEDEYLLIVYNDKNNQSQGNYLNKNELYELYIQLREIFKK